MRRKNGWIHELSWLALPALVCVSAEAQAQGNSVIFGQVRDAATGKPVPDASILVTSPALQGEQYGYTDPSGNYRIPSLPPGDGYVVRVDAAQYQPYASKSFTLHSASNAFVEVLLLPEQGVSAGNIDIRVVATAPTLDYTTGVKTSIGADMMRRVPLNAPAQKGAGTRSIEGLATVAPGTFTDTYGVSMNGSTSPESGFVIDGLSANDAAFGVLGTPLSSEFVREVNIITAGYLPEYGRSIGGVLDAVTKSGSNEFHGSFFSAITPGALEAKRASIPREGSTITTDARLGTIQDVGFELGGPILKDKLWFFMGLSFAIQKTRLERNLNKLLYEQNADGSLRLDADGNPIPIVDSATGFQRTQRLPGTTTTADATSRTTQYIGKLTWNVSPSHNVSLSVFGVPTSAGGDGDYPFNLQSGAAPANLAGSPGALGGQVEAFTNNVVLKTSSSFAEKKYLLDTTFGWVYGSLHQNAADGSGVDDVDDPSKLAGIPSVTWRRSTGGRHPITDFETLPASAASACAAGGDPAVASLYCPVVGYVTGGSAALLRRATQNRFQGRAIFTAIGKLAGTHIMKAGVDFEGLTYASTRAISGGNAFRESRGGGSFSDARRYGFLEGPDKPVFLDRFSTNSSSITVGGFVQDSWTILDRVTLNLGLRYDAQVVTGNDGNVGISLPNQWSPRVGAIWDPTGQGKAKIFGNYARFYQAITLNMVDRSFPGELNISSSRRRTTCDPRNVSEATGSCDDPNNLIAVGGPESASQKFVVVGSDRVPVDPSLKPQSSDQFVVGAEYAVLPDARLGATYTHQSLNEVVEDMSRDEATTYFIGNPGSGIASEFPKAVRDYDAVTVLFEKTFSDAWLAQASYTASFLRGNIAGLFRPETGQLDPNINSDFDLISLLPNRTGPLPGDRTHSIKVFGAREFVLPNKITLSVGAGYTARSGTPINVLGSHPLYLAGEVFVLPRGEGGRTPWVHSIDTNLTAGFPLGGGKSFTLGVDIFNIANFQAVTNVDANYTFADVRPVINGKMASLPGSLEYWEGGKFDEVDKNPNFGKPTGFQAPRQVRFNARVTF